MSKGAFITFEGTEGGGKTTQIALLCERLKSAGWIVRVLREPGGTLIGEEIRFTLKHSPNNGAMSAEAELLLMNASRAQLVREIIRPALSRGEIILCDRFYDSTTAYQGYGRQLDLDAVRAIIDFAVGETRPDLTLWLDVPPDVSEARRLTRQEQQRASSASGKPGSSADPLLRDRMEEADRAFFVRVQEGFQAIARSEPARVKAINATSTVPEVAEAVWKEVSGFLAKRPPCG